MHQVLIVDDHAVVREGFRRLLDSAQGFQVVAETGLASEALTMARRFSPDLALVDMNLGRNSSGLELLPHLGIACPGMRRVVLSMHDDPGLVLRALESGADGYFTKSVAAGELIDGLRRIVNGERVLSSDLAPPEVGGCTRLTARERETLHWLLSSLPPKAIAAELGISDKTFYRHRANLMEKLGVRYPGELARVVRERGLLIDRS